MAVTNAVSTLSAMLTENYADKLLDLIPNTRVLYKSIKFQPQEQMPGNLFHQPVVLTNESGITFNADGSAFSLTDPGPLAFESGDAQVRGAITLLPTNISYAVLSRLRHGKKVFMEGLDSFVQRNIKSHSKHIELSLMYGNSSLGDTSEVTASGSSGTMTITAASWIPALWAGGEGLAFDLFQTTGAASATNANGKLIVTAVNFSTRVVSFSCAAADATDLNNLTTAFVYRRGEKTGASSFTSCVGLNTALTASGTVFNISTSAYSLWAAQSYSASSAALTFAKVQAANVLAANKGLDGKCTVLCGLGGWKDLMVEQAALRKYDGSYNKKKAENGMESIEFQGVTGPVEILPSPFVKDGEAFLIPMDMFSRIGTSDISFKVPGAGDRDLVLNLESSAGYQIRTFSDQALLPKALGQCVKITNITNS